MTTGTDDRYRAFRVAYDGRAYHGFQRQPDVPTIEGELIEAFATHGVDVLDGSPRYAAAGRTDAGASARAQTIAARCPPWLSPAALNGELADEIHAWAAADVEPSFHPRHDAAQRVYTYQLSAAGLDVDRARTVCTALEGTHDFRNLTSTSEGTTRTVTAIELRPAGDFAVLTVRAPAFLRQQVRRMARLVREVGMGRRSQTFTERVLGEPLQGEDGIPPAPPERLVLREVTYPGVTFEVDSRASTRAREIFGERALASRGAGRALDEIAVGLE